MFLWRQRISHISRDEGEGPPVFKMCHFRCLSKDTKNPKGERI